MPFTKDQMKAIETYGKNIIVSAGAGSGKTAVLTERVIHFIKDHGYKIKDFLILTFTNLAASEMRHRIGNKLKKVGLATQDEIDASDIKTFDSFALYIVKKYHTRLNLSKDVGVATSAVLDVKKRTILTEIFDEYYKDNLEFQNLISNYYKDNDDKDIFKLVLKIHHKASIQLDFNEYLDELDEFEGSDEQINLIEEFYLEKLLDYKKEFKDELAKIPSDIKFKKADKDDAYTTIYLTYKDYLQSTTYEDLLSNWKKYEFTSPKGFKSVFDPLKAVASKIEKLSTLPKNYVEWKEYLEGDSSALKTLISLVKELEQRFSKFKFNMQVFEFQDIAKMAYHLVLNDNEVKEELKNKYKMIMVDEYQDTSLIQDEFIKLIGQDNIYMVGDIKQSIYRFRDARCDIFKDKYDNYKKGNGGIAIDMNKNFRSRREVLEDINFIFSNIMLNENTGIDYKESHKLDFGLAPYQENMYDCNYHSEFLTYESGTDDTKSEAELIVNDIIKKINNKFQVFDKDTQKLRDIQFKDFCIIMDRGTKFDTYLKVFNENKVPLYAEKDIDITENEVVLLLKNILIIIGSIQNKDYRSSKLKHAYTSIARSFIFEKTDGYIKKVLDNNDLYNDEIINIFKNICYSSTLPISLLFKEIVLKLDIYHKFIKIGDVSTNTLYLDTFLELFSEMSNLNYSLDEFINYLDLVKEFNLKITVTNQGTSLDSVRIMNIHKSKGLEFPICYFSGLSRAFNDNDLEEQYNISDKYGLIIPDIRHNNSRLIEPNKVYEYKEDRAEKIRLFYVALTRTREHAVFVTKCADEKKKKALPLSYHNYALNNTFKSFLENSKEKNIDELFKDYKDKKISDYWLFILICKFKLNYPLLFDMVNSISEIDENINCELQLMNDELLLDKAKSIIDDIINSDDVDEYDILNKLKDKFIEKEITYEELIACLHYKGYKVRKEFNQNFNPLISSKSEEKLEDTDVFDMVDFSISPKIFNAYYSNSKQEFINIIESLLSSQNLILLDKVCNLLNLNDRQKEYIKSLIENINLNEVEDKNQILNSIYIMIILKSTNQLKENIFDTLVNASLNNIITEDEMTMLISKSYYIFQVIDKLLSLNPPLEFETFKNIMDILDIDLLFDCNTYAKIILDLEPYHPLDYFVLRKPIEYYNLANIRNKLINSDYQNKDLVLECLDYLVEAPKEFDSLFELIAPFSKDYELYSKLTSGIEKYENRIEVNYENLKLDEFKYESKRIEYSHASKTLDLNSSEELLELGTKLHYAMETLDFIDPNLDLLDSLEQSVVKKFLSSDLTKDISNAKIYKEFEFIDNNTNTNGIIDLMLVYQDRIDIIDYKTKHISDKAYDKQLYVYKDYIKIITDKTINLYLYSLLDGTYRKVD